MDILGIGPLEFILILIIAFIVLGPADMVKAGRTIGKFLRKIVTSPTWRAVTQTSNEIRRIPNKLIREAGLEEELSSLQDIQRQGLGLNQAVETWKNDISPWTTPPGKPEPGTELDPAETTNSPEEGETLQD